MAFLDLGTSKMRVPSDLELLGVQTPEDAEIIKRDYPEWCALSDEARGYPYRIAQHKEQSIIEIFVVSMFILSSLFIVWLM